MSPGEPKTLEDSFFQAWSDAISHVLGQVAGAPFSCTPAGDAISANDATADKGIWLRFASSGKLKGELAFFSVNADAVQFAQLLVAESRDVAAAISDTHRDALRELFQQFSGAAATACKSLFGGEVQFSFAAAEMPAWKWAIERGWKIHQEKAEDLVLRIFVSQDLATAIKPAAVPKSQAAPDPASKTPEQPIPVPEPAVTDANLGLLLDVELEASLRFGQREMLLREILDLRPGLVIELDRRLHEPAELLVAGRVIARGEVVIVDGNYGLRVTEITCPQDRLESLQTGLA